MDFMRRLEKSLPKELRGTRLENGKDSSTSFKTLDRISTAINTFNRVEDLYKDVRSYYRNRTTWTVTVEEKDTLYREVEAWLLDELPEKKHRSIVASTSTVFVDSKGDESVMRKNSFGSSYFTEELDSGSGSSSGGYSETRVDVGVIDTQNAFIRLGDNKVQVFFNKTPEDPDRNDGETRRARTSSVSNGKITFSCRSLSAQKAVINKLEALVGGRTHRKPNLWVADSWGGWNPNNEAPVRKLDSVVLPSGVKEDLRGDIQKFLRDEERYSELGIPWHRGMLLHGPPGTGKTSLIKALAGELGLDLWYAPLNDIKEDAALLDLIRRVRPRGILLLEDVDSFASATNRESKEGVSTSALLNALDGVVTPHGLITIMTTNHLDKLDPALFRSGRADRVVELGLPEWDEVQNLWGLFFPDEEPLTGNAPTGFDGIELSHAEISEVLKRNWDFPDEARKELMNRVAG